MRVLLTATRSLLALLAWLLLAAVAHAEVVELERAWVVVRPEGQTTAPELPTLEPLPYHWDRIHKGQAGVAEFELHFSTPSAATVDPWGIYFPRIGNTADIWLNGTLLASLGDIADPNTADYSKGPQYVTVPPQLLMSENLLRIVVRADGGRRGGLARPVLGPQSEVWPLYRETYSTRVGASVVIAVFSVLVGGMALALWVTQRDWQHGGRRDAIYLSAALAEFCWALRVGDVLIERPPLDWPLWGVVVTAAFAGWICGIAWFCHSVAGWHRHRSSRWMQAGLWVLLGSSVAASAASLTLQQPLWLTLWLGTANLVFTAYALVYLWQALRHRQDHLRLVVGLAGGLNVAVGVRDWLAIRLAGGLEVNTWLRYSAVLFGLALAVIVIVRFRAESGRARDLTHSLVQRIAQKEQELALSYSRLERLAREQATASERARILRDMHDGVGMHLSTAIRLLRSDSADRAELLRTLTDSMDQLKLSIDALQCSPGDVGALLAALRYRLEPRLNAGGLKLQWVVEELPHLPWLDTQGTRNLQFMLFEAISNALQHAHASLLTVSARAQEDAVHIEIADDGQGFDTTRASTRGLQAMRERVAAIHVPLHLTSGAGGTRVEVVLPLRR